MLSPRRSFVALALWLAFSAAVPAQAPPAPPSVATPTQLAALQSYIKVTWQKLTRSNAQIAIAAADPKFKPLPGGRWPVYISAKENMAAVRGTLSRDMGAEFSKISLLRLPAAPNQVKDQGLLYLPYPYVVPGGRFNEMYGWDSYFIQVGLLRDGELGPGQGHGR